MDHLFQLSRMQPTSLASLLPHQSGRVNCTRNHSCDSLPSQEMHNRLQMTRVNSVLGKGARGKVVMQTVARCEQKEQKKRMEKRRMDREEEEEAQEEETRARFYPSGKT